MKKLATILLCVLAVACSKPFVESITFTEPDLIEMLPGGIRMLNYVIVPASHQQAELIWSSTDPTIAEVQKGYLFAYKAGECVITAKYADVSASVNVKVNNVWVTKATYSVSYLEIPAGESRSFEVTSIVPSYANATNIFFHINPADRKYFEVTEVNGMTVTVTCKPGTPDNTKVMLYCSGAGDNNLGDIELYGLNRPITGLTLDAPSSMRASITKVMNAVISPEKTTSPIDLEWECSNTEVATLEVDEDPTICKIKGLKEGQVTVTVTEKNSELYASKTITINKARDYDNLSLCFYNGFTDNGDGTITMKGKDEFPTKILPGGNSVRIYLGLSDGKPLTEEDFDAEEIKVEVNDKVLVQRTSPLISSGEPYFYPIRINDLGATGTIKVTLPNGKSASRSFTTAITSITAEYRYYSEAEFSGFTNSSRVTTFSNKGTYNPKTMTAVTFCINSGNEINTWDIEEPGWMFFGSCSANIAFYDTPDPGAIRMSTKGLYRFDSESAGKKYIISLSDYYTIMWYCIAVE